MENPFIPHLAKIIDLKEEVGGIRPIKTFKVEIIDETAKKNFKQKPGQCAMLGILSKGECMFAINSSPTETGYLSFSILKTGKVTTILHQCEIGDIVTVRGPYGNGFPVNEWEGKNIVTIGGGIGQSPLRPVIYYILANRDKYKKFDLIYGARSSADLCFKEELFQLEKRNDVNVHLSIDVPEEGWNRYVGFVPNNLMEVNPNPENTIAITCGPPIMIKFVIQNLLKLGFNEENIFTTLENRMKCGIGKCGRCNINELYVCKDGPVFNYATLKKHPEAFA